MDRPEKKVLVVKPKVTPIKTDKLDLAHCSVSNDVKHRLPLSDTIIPVPAAVIRTKTGRSKVRRFWEAVEDFIDWMRLTTRKDMDLKLNGRKHHHQRCRKITLTFLRWLIIATGFGVVLQGWIRSGRKYMAAKSSVSITVNESARFTYPSITLCPRFKYNANLLHLINELDYKYNKTELTEADFKEMVDRLSYERHEFMDYFAHPEFGDPRNPAFNIVNNDTSFIETIPHQEYSGKCYTYNPPFKSMPGQWYSIYMHLKYPQHITAGMPENSTEFRNARRKWLSDLGIYIHDKNQFFFYREDDMPSNSMVDTSLLRHGQTNSLILHYSRSTSLDLPKQPCDPDQSYVFMTCFENENSRRRGCQKPWNHFNDSKIPVCTDIKQTVQLLGREQEWSQPFWSTIERSQKSGCHQPCTKTKYRIQYSYIDDGDTNTDFPIYIWFKNFKFQYDEEYVVCDWTCLIGEIGGNFGFFLGGSILAMYDVLYTVVERNI